MKCRGLRTTCRECRIRFDKEYRDETCPECGADRKCNKDSVKGYDYCETHGGPNPKNNYYGAGRGIVTGENSKFMLTRLASKYREALENGRLLSNRATVDVIDRRILELADRIDEKNAPERVAQLHTLWTKYRKLQDDGKTLEANLTLEAIDEVFDAVYHDYAAWSQMFEALDLRRKSVESEVKILKSINAMLSAEDAVELVAKIFGVIIHIEDDPKKLKRYQYELTRLIGDFPGEIPDTEIDLGSGNGSGEIIDA